MNTPARFQWLSLIVAVAMAVWPAAAIAAVDGPTVIGIPLDFILFGGSMMWCGSSAGVAASNVFPRAKSVFRAQPVPAVH